MCGVTEEQDNEGDAAISLLQGNSPLEGLHVGDVRLRFDSNDPTRARDRRIPCPLVA